GQYSIELPKGYDYTLKVAAAFDGYKTPSADVILSSNKVKNFSVNVTETCSAPGYAFGGAGGFNEDFNGETFPPDGWTVTNGVADSPLTWHLNPWWDQNNVTGGTNTAADMRQASFDLGYFGPYDSSLVTPPIDVASLSGPVLRYK